MDLHSRDRYSLLGRYSPKSSLASCILHDAHRACGIGRNPWLEDVLLGASISSVMTTRSSERPQWCFPLTVLGGELQHRLTRNSFFLLYAHAVVHICLELQSTSASGCQKIATLRPWSMSTSMSIERDGCHIMTIWFSRVVVRIMSIRVNKKPSTACGLGMGFFCQIALSIRDQSRHQHGLFPNDPTWHTVSFHCKVHDESTYDAFKGLFCL